MTAIAYRDRVMAADTMIVWSDQHIKQVNETKVMKEQGHLIGIAGENCPRNEVFARWFFGAKTRGLSKYKFDAMVIMPDGTINLYDQTGAFNIVTAPYFAIGTGAEVCMGAMWKGATAVEAVAAAIEHCPTVGGEVRMEVL